MAPKSRGVCFATFSGDLAPALLTLGAEVELAGPHGRRTLPLKSMIGLLPFVWVGFLINVLSGSMLFIYGATNFGVNHAFWLKMTFMVLAGLNALAFDLSVRRSKVDWVGADLPPLYVKAFATLSFMLWLCVVTTGRDLNDSTTS